MLAKRVNITMPMELLEKVDMAADAMHLSRSSYIAVAVSQKIQQDEMMKQLPYLVHKMQSAEADTKQG